jgi:ribonucleoside-diphosphate reductase alpha chain
MKIKKQNNTFQEFMPEKILERIKQQAIGLKVDPNLIFKKAIAGVVDGMATKDIDSLIAKTAADFILHDPDYSYLASRILITRHAKIIDVEPIDSDFLFDYKGFKAFLHKYSQRDDEGNPIELPHMAYARIAEYYWKNDIDEKLRCYNALRTRKQSLATPQVINAGTNNNGLLSCQTYSLEDDSKEGINETLKQISLASADSSGIGLHLHNLRSEHTLVSSFKGKAGGVVKMCKMVESHMGFFKQGNRSGSCAVYLGIWHRDIYPFLELRLQTGEHRRRTPDLFTAVCIPDLFYKLLLKGETEWYLFCPHEVQKAGFKNLYDTYGAEFEDLYYSLIKAGLGYKTDIKKVWFAVLKSMAEAGLPYVFNWGNANKNHPQSNIGICRGYQLCIEFSGISRPGYAAQCDLGLIPLESYGRYPFDAIAETVKGLVRDLNKAIDLTDWSNESAKKAGLHQRSIGIGIAGLADWMHKHKLDFVGDEAKEFNEKLMDCIYNTAKEESHRLAVEQGRTYGAYKGSKYEAENYPMLNSILVCLMPSASTSLLLGCNESFEPYQGNIYLRNIDAGEFIVINKYMVRELQEMGMWNEDTWISISKENGSVQHLDVPNDFKQRYKTTWEHSQKDLITLAGLRQKNIDQGQSMNLYFKDATSDKIGGALLYAWQQGLPTGSYYCKTQSKLSQPAGLTTKTKTTVAEGWDIECYNCSS